MATLSRPTCGPEVLAKLDGPCKGCPEPIICDEHYIVKVEGVGWMHALCATNYCRIFEEHEEDNEGTAGAQEES